MLINGVPGDSISINDRGLLYGDGVFRTMRVKNGLLQNWPRHYNKLHHDCVALDLDCPAMSILIEELGQLIQQQPDGVAKVVITRGLSARGYTPPQHPFATRILSISPGPVFPETFVTRGVKLHLCNLKLSHQPKLAGIKHLNRLENVLAATELMQLDVQDGLLFDCENYLIESTKSNIFLVHGEVLLTPDLSYCGVAGVQRDRVIDWAQQNRLQCHIVNLSINDLLAADEVFLVNSVIGLWPVLEMPGFRREYHPISQRIHHWLNHENN